RSAKDLERKASLQGLLEILDQMPKPGSPAPKEALEYYLNVKNTRITLRFSGEPKKKYLTGDEVKVSGVQLDTFLALDTSNSGYIQPVTTVSGTNTFGEQKILLILVNFSDDIVQPYTPDSARSVLFTTTNNFYLDNSMNQVSLTG